MPTLCREALERTSADEWLSLHLRLRSSGSDSGAEAAEQDTLLGRRERHGGKALRGNLERPLCLGETGVFVFWRWP